MGFEGLPLLSTITFLPLVGALVVAVLPRNSLGAIRGTALLFALITWAASLWLLASYLPATGGGAAMAFQYVEQHEWIPLFGIQYKLGVDGLSVALVVLTTTLSWIAILASFSPIKVRVKEYMIAFLVLEVGLLGAFMALDLFLFYVFWEVVLVPLYPIIGIWGGANRIYATLKFVLYTLVGSFLMLVAVLAAAYTYRAATGSWEGAFDLERLAGFGFDPAFQLVAFAAFAIAFAIKVPMFPFHTWLADAHVEAPTAGSVILAGLLLKLGGYGFIRFAVPIFPEGAIAFAPLIIALSVVAIIYGAIVALVQPDLKKLVAFSSVSHMGFVTLGIFVFQEQGLQGAILQMINHGLITGALFLLIGVIYERTHDRAIAKMGGLGGPLPVYSAMLGLFLFASAGLPGLAGFVGEFLVFQGAFAHSPWIAAIIALAMILGAAYLLWLAQRVLFGPLSGFLRGLGHQLTDMRPVEVLTVAPLATLTVVLGIFPGLVLDLVAGPVRAVLAAVDPGLAAGLGR
jgi:NADH-quinone oxidoreductase subunit M